MTWNRFWLDVLPGVAVLLGGLVLIAARNRAVGVAGGWLALVGGAWFIADEPDNEADVTEPAPPASGGGDVALGEGDSEEGTATRRSRLFRRS
jgi:hypothetical protein